FLRRIQPEFGLGAMHIRERRFVFRKRGRKRSGSLLPPPRLFIAQALFVLALRFLRIGRARRRDQQQQQSKQFHTRPLQKRSVKRPSSNVHSIFGRFTSGRTKPKMRLAIAVLILAVAGPAAQATSSKGQCKNR